MRLSVDVLFGLGYTVEQPSIATVVFLQPLLSQKQISISARSWRVESGFVVCSVCNSEAKMVPASNSILSGKRPHRIEDYAADCYQCCSFVNVRTPHNSTSLYNLREAVGSHLVGSVFLTALEGASEPTAHMWPPSPPTAMCWRGMQAPGCPSAWLRMNIPLRLHLICLAHAFRHSDVQEGRVRQFQERLGLRVLLKATRVKSLSRPLGFEPATSDHSHGSLTLWTTHTTPLKNGTLHQFVSHPMHRGHDNILCHSNFSIWHMQS